MRDQSKASLSNIQAILLAFAGFSFWTFSDAIIRFLRAYEVMEMAFVYSTAATILCIILAPLLGGFRGRPQADIQAIIDSILSLERLSKTAEITEIEINPLFVRAEGAKPRAIVGDALLAGTSNYISRYVN